MTIEERVGRQTPNPETHIHKPDLDSYMDRPFVREKMRQFGLILFPWQENVLRDWLAIENMVFAYRVIMLIIARRNGKTWAIIFRIIAGLVLFKEKQLYTAQLGSTADEIFMSTKAAIMRNANLYKYFKGADSLPKDKSEKLTIIAYDPKSGNRMGSCTFATRGGKVGRGQRFDVVYFDEAQDLTPDQDKALSATVSTALNGQLYYVGTAASADSASSFRKQGARRSNNQHFAELRNKVITGQAYDANLNEWSTDKLTTRDDVETIYRTNPSIGLKMGEGEALTLRSIQADPCADVDWATERCGFWPTQAKGTILDISRWRDLQLSSTPKVSGNSIMGLAIKTTPGNGDSGGRIDVVLSIRTPETTYLDLIGSISMADAWSDKLWELIQPFVRNRAVKSILIDGMDGIPAILELLTKQGIWNPRANPRSQRNISLAQAMDITQACSLLVSSATEKTVTPIKNEPLDAAVEDAGKRKIGNSGGYGFMSISGKVDVNYLETAALALHAAMRHKINDGADQESSSSGPQIHRGMGTVISGMSN